MGGLVSTLRFGLEVIREGVHGYNELKRRVETSPGIPRSYASSSAAFSSPCSTPPALSSSSPTSSATLPPTSPSLSSALPPPSKNTPFWQHPPSPLARHGEHAPLPCEDEVDVVVIGSGITGTGVVKALLELGAGDRGKERKLRVVMLEARDACSGSTGRNGGHVGPVVYNEYPHLKSSFGKDKAIEILRFRTAHVSTLFSTARAEGLAAFPDCRGEGGCTPESQSVDSDKLELDSDSQARMVEGFDVYGHEERWERAKEELKVFLKEAPGDLTEGYGVVGDLEGIEALQLDSRVVLGCIRRPGGAIHPYRFVTGILSNLLKGHANFQLYTHTPCTAITSTPSGYLIQTPRGKFKTKHVVHATNAWASHLLPGMRGKVVPTRTTMTAQRPGRGLSNGTETGRGGWEGKRSFVFYPVEDTSVFQYLTQLVPTGKTSKGSKGARGGEMMFGGRVQPSFMNNVGIADDTRGIFENEAHLGGALERFFADQWGAEGRSESESEREGDGSRNDGKAQRQSRWGKGRVKSTWSGLLGMSADLQPWVGRVPRSASGRDEPRPSRAEDTNGVRTPKLAAPGEWICAGYTGEGMVHAWHSGRALACKILGVGEDEAGELSLPSPFLITEKRVREVRYQDTVKDW